MLVDRDDELAALEALVSGARRGRAGALVLVGEAGIGKTSLISAAVELAGANDLAVARVVGVQAERDLPYAGLHTLLSQVDVAPDVLPPVQQSALHVALGVAAGPAPGRLVLGSAVLGLLSEHRGLLLVVDDLQWLDQASADGICFAARRLRAECVAVLLAVRADAGLEPLSPASGLPEVALGGIRDGAALLPRVHPSVARALASSFAGNPLAMIESSAGLTPAEAAGDVPLPRQLPVSRPEQLYRERLDLLPPEARRAARVLAHSGRAPRGVVIAALAATGLAAEHLDAVEATGLCSLGTGGDTAPTVSWRHPLARSAAGRGGHREVRRAHAALAAGWGEEAGAARAWHLAEAADGPDAVAADALVAAAHEAERRDASCDAADAWERAARLGDPAQLPHRLERAADAAFRAGATRRASALLDRALQEQPGPDAAARLLHRRGRIEHTLGNPRVGLGLLEQAVDLASDPLSKVWAAAEGVFAAMYCGQPAEATRMAALAQVHHDPRDPVQAFLATHARGAAASLSYDEAAARAAMDEARCLLATHDLLGRHPELALWVVNIELFDPTGAALPAGLGEVMERMRTAGDFSWLPRVTRLAAICEQNTQRHESALGLLDEAEMFSRMAGQGTQLAEALLLRAEHDALRGDSTSAQRRLDEAARLLDSLQLTWLDAQLSWVRALDHLTQGREAASIDPLRGALEGDPGSTPLLLDVVLRTHGRDAAIRELETRPPLPTVLQDHAGAVLDEDLARGAAGLVRSADQDPFPQGAAITRLLAGERLRRAGERRAAREQLRLAVSLFESLGATPWVQRTEAELRATGVTLRRRAEGERLTESERRVVTLVAAGSTNKEVAAVLFLSPKTVEFHLGRAFRKLGVTNRTALARALE